VTNEEKTDIKVGLTVIAGIVLLLFGIGWAKQWTLASHEETHRAIFATAAGLGRGDPVTVNGINRETVKDIELEQDGVIVTVAFSEHVDLRKDATARISMLELMGGKKVELRPGTSPDELPQSALIPGINSGDIGTLVAMVTSLSGKLESITGRADTLLAGLNSILQGDTLKQKLNRTLDAADKTLGNVGDLSRRASAFVSDEGPILTKTLSQADSTLHSISSALAENRAGIRVFIDSGGRAIGEARSALVKLDTLIANAGRKNTLLFRLTRDTTFANRVDSVVASLMKLTEQLRKQGLDANIRFFESAKPEK
jgi:phospholipid/cholesterol/gamma-HCH transport system substrate-binding protein